MTLRFDFSNRVLLLTGANGGIGRATAQLFAQSGAHLVLADPDGGALDDFPATLEGTGEILALPYDAADPASAAHLVDTAVARFGALDFIVPGAAVYTHDRFATMTPEQWHRTVDVNLSGLYHLLAPAQHHMRDGSAIVLMSSMAGHRGSLTNAHYAATKGATTALAKSLAQELAPKVRVNAVAPGIIETPMTAAFIAGRGEATIASTPLRRFGQAAEVASVIAFLCSEASSFVTGEVIHVNGGLYISG